MIQLEIILHVLFLQHSCINETPVYHFLHKSIYESRFRYYTLKNQDHDKTL